MESDGTYQADASATTEDATPGKVVPLRTFTQFDNELLMLAASSLSLGATRCLLYLMRYTTGFHIDEVKLTVDEFCKGKRRKEGGRHDDGARLSRPSVLSGLHELEEDGLIAVESVGRGRGIVCRYRILSPGIGKKSLPINQGAHIGKNCSPIPADNGKEVLPIAPIIGKKSLPHINKEKRKKEEKEKGSDATASAGRVNASAPPKKLKTPEEREQHNAEATYVTSLLKRLREHLHGAKLPNEKQERAAGHWFYSAGTDGAPADVEQIMACYAVVKQSPFWSGRFLSLQSLTKNWPDWLEDPAMIRRNITDERQRTDRARAFARGLNGHEPQAAIPATIRRFGGADD